MDINKIAIQCQNLAEKEAAINFLHKQFGYSLPKNKLNDPDYLFVYLLNGGITAAISFGNEMKEIIDFSQIHTLLVQKEKVVKIRDLTFKFIDNFIEVKEHNIKFPAEKINEIIQATKSFSENKITNKIGIRCNSVEEIIVSHDFLNKVFGHSGYPQGVNNMASYFPSYTDVWVCDDNVRAPYITISVPNFNQNLQIINFNEIYKLLLLNKQIIKVVLNNVYTAVIDKNTIKVGCQTFTPAELESLKQMVDNKE